MTDEHPPTPAYPPAPPGWPEGYPWPPPYPLPGYPWPGYPARPQNKPGPLQRFLSSRSGLPKAFLLLLLALLLAWGGYAVYRHFFAAYTIHGTRALTDAETNQNGCIGQGG